MSSYGGGGDYDAFGDRTVEDRAPTNSPEKDYGYAGPSTELSPGDPEYSDTDYADNYQGPSQEFSPQD